MIEDVKKFRWSIPPVVLAFFIFLAMVIDIEGRTDLQYILETSKNSPITGLLVSATGVIAFGFLISSIAHLLLNIMDLAARYLTWFPAGHRPNWSRPALRTIKFEFSDGPTQFEKMKGVQREIIEWLIQDGAPKNIQNNIQRRWEMFSVNLNCGIAVLIAMLILRLFQKQTLDNEVFLLTWCFALGVFIWNAIATYLDVHGIDNFLAEHSRKLKVGYERMRVKVEKPQAN